MDKLFIKQKPVLIGMIHLLPTLGYVTWPGLKSFLKKAKNDLLALEEAGFDAALIENDGDHPCKVNGDPDVVVCMSIVAYELKKIAKIPLGIEVLLNDPKASLAISQSVGLDFIRTDYFVDRMERDGYGEFNIDPKGVMEYRHKINAENVKILADVQVKYATMLEEKSISTSVVQAIEEGADGVIVSGKITGNEPLVTEAREAKEAAMDQVPVIIGSGFSIGNARQLLKYADLAIVGSSIKTNGAIDIKKAKELVELVRKSGYGN